MTYKFLLSFLFALTFALSIPASVEATPGAACENIDDCAPTGERCIQNVCRASCTQNPSSCSTGTTCQSYSTGSSAKFCIPDDSSYTPVSACSPACDGEHECRYIESIAAYRCIDENGAAATVGGNGAQGGGLTNPLMADNLGELLRDIVGGVQQLMMMVLVLALVYVGFLFVFAQGNEEKIKSARQALFWTVIGGLLVLGMGVISALLEQTVNNVTS